VSSDKDERPQPVPEQAPVRAMELELAEELARRAKAEGVDLVGPGGLLQRLTKQVLETGLEAEMSEHLGYDKHDPAGRNGGNSRNGTRAKTVTTDVGPVEINVPRDREGRFDPKTVGKRKRRLHGVDEMVISLAGKGLTTGEISAHLAEVYGADVSKDTISRITDAVIEEMTSWQNRPLDVGRFPAIVANQVIVVWRLYCRMIWVGVLSLRQCLGRSLSSVAISSSCWPVQPPRSVPLGRYWRSRPLAFSLVPRCQGACGSAK
jgi:putative transposase